MTSKEYLNQAFRIDRRILAKTEQLESLRAVMVRTSKALTGMPGNPNKDRSQLEETMVKALELERMIKEDTERLMDLKREITLAVREVDDVQCQMLLELRYLCFRTWEEIAAELDCSVRNVHFMHGRALGMVKVPKK